MMSLFLFDLESFQAFVFGEGVGWASLILLIVISVGIPLFSYCRKIHKSFQALEQEKIALIGVAENVPEARCWWIDHLKQVGCTHSFSVLLDLNLNHPVELVDITNQFEAQDALALDQDIHNLTQTGQSFARHYTLLGHKTILLITGVCVDQKTQKLIILTAVDVTQKLSKSDSQLIKIRQLTEERDLLRALIDVVPVALWFRDKDNTIRYCNLAYAGALDSQPHRVVAESKELIEKDRNISPYHLGVKAKETGEKQTQRGHLIIAGHRRLLEMAEIPLPGQEATIGYALDLTEVEEAEAELEKHILAYQEVVEHLSTPVAIFSADTHLQFFNTAYQKLFNFEEAWLHTKPSLGDILQDLRERRKLPEYPDFVAFKNERLSLFKTLMSPTQELIHQPDDHILRAMIAPHPLGGLLFMFEDVTDKLALERRHNTLIAVQKETLDHLYEGIMVFGSDNRLRLSNPAIYKIWKLDQMDVVPGSHASEILEKVRLRFSQEEEWELLKERLIKLLNQRQAKTGRFNLADHSMIQYAYVPLPDGSHLLSFIDVSDRWKFEQVLQERNQALEQADRLKTNFLSHVSYELRAPLNTIIGFTEILMNQYFGTLNERQMDYCRGISDSSQRLLSLINDILDLASIEAGRLTLTQKSIHVESFLSSVVGLVFNRCHDQGIEISHQNNTGLTSFIADERRLKQALFNLLTNAIKFTPVGGKIELKAWISEDNYGDKKIVISVEDTGVGISIQDQARIFKLFEQTSTLAGKPHGAALGLSLVKRLIELHGGDIRIESIPDEGTKIICSIPLLVEKAETETDLDIHVPVAQSEIKAQVEVSL
jgi:signal transduction histidine kinase